MELLSVINERKSVRSYTGEQISDEQLAVILKAAEEAPVARGCFENFHLTIVTNKEILAQIDAAGAATFGNPDLHPLYGAPMYILVSAKAPEEGRENSVLSSAAIIVHSMALAATDLGVGQCDIWGATAAMSKSSQIVQSLQLPDGFVPCCGIILGQTDETYEKRDISLDRISKNTIGD